jgi:hypothetical protein
MIISFIRVNIKLASLITVEEAELCPLISKALINKVVMSIVVMSLNDTYLDAHNSITQYNNLVFR